MNSIDQLHTFHIPVMGIGYTLDSAVKVGHYGISSVLSLGDDKLIERMRKLYSEKFGRSFRAITSKDEDFRARRITAYLDLIEDIVNEKIEAVRRSFIEGGVAFEKYMRMLPHSESLMRDLVEVRDRYGIGEWRERLRKLIAPGAIDVNIMTKLDRVNYEKGEPMSREFNDAHAALRGFARSKVRSSVVFSAGMNPRLYSYLEDFDDFYPDAEGNFSKKITIKVSDYRSALVQGKFLAKKGLWVSEYRIESGLNCGGHAFATQGYLMGPILEEFKRSRNELIASVFEVYQSAIRDKGLRGPAEAPELKITAQGGVGTAEEHRFLLHHYEVSSVGWGTPFLLVPEAVSIDRETRERLSAAREKDLYLSDASPLGVPFHNLRGNTRRLDQERRIEKGKPGSPCTKEYLKFNTEFTDQPVCTASHKYQKRKIAELDALNLSREEYDRRYDKIVEKECICGGLGTSILIENDLDTRLEGYGVSVCPGPNMAYFEGEFSLEQMVDHIYGREDILARSDRPHMFLKELRLYIDHLKKQIEESAGSDNEREIKKVAAFKEHLAEGIAYYKELFKVRKSEFGHRFADFDEQLTKLSDELEAAGRELAAV